MAWFGDDITFCANKNCKDKGCYRNSKHIMHDNIPHSFALFTECEKWDDKGAEWFMKQMDEKE